MSIRDLLDEHLSRTWRRRLHRLEPSLTVQYVGDPGAPPLGKVDPAILDWLESAGFILLTRNRKSMPDHFANHLAKGSHLPGIFVIKKGTRVATLLEDLVIIAGASAENEYRDQIRFVPMT